MITKTILSALVVTLAVAANAANQSSQGLSQSLEGSAGLVGASLDIVVVDASGGAIAMSSTGAEAAGNGIKKGAMYITHTTSAQSSEDSAQSTKTAFTWVVTSTGHVLRAIKVGASAASHETTLILENPSKESSRGLDASGRGVKVSVDASGNVSTATGAYIAKKTEGPARLVMTGSGNVYEATAGSVVTVFNDSKAAVTYVGRGVSTSTIQSAKTARLALEDSIGGAGTSSEDLSTGSKDASRDLVQGGKQY